MGAVAAAPCPNAASIVECASVGVGGKTREELLREIASLRQELAELRRTATRSHEAEAEQRARLATYGQIADAANSIVLRWDVDGRVLYLNDYGLEFFGFRAEEVLGRSVIGTIVPETETSGRDLVHMIDDILRNPDRYLSNENENVRRSGERVWVTWRNRPLVDAEGRLVEILSIGIDTSERKRAESALRESEERFRYLAVHDSLTGLYNRLYLYEALEDLIRGDSGGEPISVLFIDIDNFKRVVDTHGHLNGSRTVHEVAQVILGCIAAPAFAVAYAGDEFVVVLPGFDGRTARSKAEEIRTAVSSHCFLRGEGLDVRLTLSQGIATHPDDASDRDTLLALADRALFQAKQSGKNNVRVHSGSPPRR